MNREFLAKVVPRKRSAIIYWAGLVLVCTAPQSAFSLSQGRALNDQMGKAAAPTKEDSADYFAISRTGVSKEDALKADALRGKTIDQIKGLLVKQKGSNEFELTLRLGELYVERSDYQRDLEIEHWVAAHEKWKNSEPKSRGKVPTVDYKASESQLNLAINSFRKLVTAFPKDPRTDAALYSLAGTLSRVEDENALLYYKQLITRYPASPLVPDSWLAIGEFHFDKHKIPEATEAYQHVMDFKSHRAYAFAVYKLGWCYYNTQGGNEKNPGESLRKSIAAFKLVVKLADSGTQEKKNFNLRDEAIRDLVMAFAETEDTDAAWNYFKTIGQEAKFYTMLERLGNTYADAGKTEKGIEVYNRLVTEAPTKPNNPAIYQKLVELYDSSNQSPKSVATIRTMNKLFIGKSSPWLTTNQTNPKVFSDAKEITEKTTHRYGTLFHSRGQKTKNKPLEGLAAEIYTQYLESFSTLAQAYEIRYYLADIQLDQGKYEAASTNFMMVAKQNSKDGKYLKESALMAVTAIARLNEQEKFPALPPAGQVSKAIEIPRSRQLYTKVIDQYIDLLPNEKEGNGMRFTAAQIFFDYGHYDIAVKRFDDIATQLSSTKQGQTSARVIVTLFNEKSDWSKVIAYGKKYQANKQIVADAGVKKFLEDSLRAALFNSALGYEKSKSYEKAAVGFLEFRRIFPADSNADRAVYNASLNFFKAGRIEEALAQQRQLLQDYPRSALAPDVTASMGETYEALAQFRNAGDTYKKF
ncbi:MAG: tetratricopeptide repeat protein [Proteobacteria bacterium]|nr:tetratricopeptide repeat protein [Pseudomonadota bacterium]